MIIDGEWEKDVESSPLREEPDFDAIAEDEYWQHCDEAHGGKPCNCPPGKPLAARRRPAEAAAAFVAGVLRMFRSGGRTWSLRLGPFEVTFRRRPASPCGICQGRGWWYTKGTVNPLPPPPGYDGATLCPCGSAVDELADSRRRMRQWERENRNEPPF